MALAASSSREKTSPFHAVRISEHVYWVGAVDWDIRDFHGYQIPFGTTYNAYLILAEKITLIDTVKAPFFGEMMERIASLVDPARIDYLISNHAEMDHSGALPAVIEAVRPERIFASTMGVKALQDHFHLAREITGVKDGETLSLGDLTLSFTDARMLHWPDSMFTFLAEDGVLFSNDAFGMHLASLERFADELDAARLDHEAEKYYANILLPYSHLITKLIAKLQGLALPIAQLAPDHGPVWRTDPMRIVAQYARWAEQRPTNKAVIVYDTMWESTARMAHAVGEGLRDGGARVSMCALQGSHRSDIVTELLDAGALLVGSPTLNNNIFPTLADVLTYIKGLKPRNKIGVAFGSYGWSGEAVGQIHELFTTAGIEVVGEGVRVKYVPDAAALGECYALGTRVAEILRQKLEE